MNEDAEKQRWLRLSRLFDAVVDLPADARKTLLDAECADDAVLRAELERMLAAAGTESGLDDGAMAVLAAAEAEENDAQGERLGPWLLGSLLGRGGMGSVHAACRDDDSGQRAAIKRLRHRWNGSALAQRFLQERKILASLSHAHIPALIDHGVDSEGCPWFALEHVDGAPLTDWADVRRLGLKQRIELFLQVCAAVQYAHEHFVVHRDLKPANILVDGEGRARVLDFGVAKKLEDEADLQQHGMTRTGMHAGFTPEYAAPEQFSGGAVSAATDVHALGVVLYQLLSGRLPFTFDNGDLRAAAETVSTQSAARLDQAVVTGNDEAVRQRLASRSTDLRGFRNYVRGDLARIVQTALAKEPPRRYASVLAFAADLQRFLEGRPVSVTGDTWGYRAGKFVRRNAVAVAVTGLLAVGLLATSAYSVHRAHLEKQQREAAQANLERANATRDFVVLMFRKAGESGNARDLTARQLLAKGVRDITVNYKDDPDTGLPLATTLAELMIMLGDSEGAGAVLDAAMQWPQTASTPAAWADAHYEFARALYEQNQLARAHDVLEKAQAYWRQAGQSQAERLNESQHVRAQLQRGEGKLEAALETLDAAIAERHDVLKLQDQPLLTLHSQRGLVLVGLGKPEQALGSYNQAMALAEKLDIAATTDGLGLLNNRAQANALLQKPREAETDFRRAVDIYRDNYGESAQLAALLSNLAATIAMQGPERSAEVVPLLEDAVRIGTASGGANARTTLYARGGLTRAYLSIKDFDKARALLVADIPVVESQYTQDPVLNAQAAFSRAQLRLHDGERVAACADMQRAAALYITLGPAGRAKLAAIAPLDPSCPLPKPAAD